jgi:thiamine biosynthesis lipoprotein
MTTMTMTTTTNMTMTTTTMTTTMTTKRASAPEWGWQQHSFRAMNTGVFAQLFTPRRSPGRTVEEMFRYYEQLLSRFQPSSELSRLNSHPEPVFVASADLYAAVEAAIWAAQQTGGIFDPTILPYLERAGYDCTFAALPNKRSLAAGEAPFQNETTVAQPDNGSNYRHVRLDPSARLIGRPVGLLFDLGGMGKGWTVDRAVDDLRDSGAFLINAGGDLFAFGTPPNAPGWDVHLAHPTRPEISIATLSVAHRAVATSTIARRRWLHDNRINHHLIDPRTGRSAGTDVVSVSVVCERVFTAEVYAKTALIMGRYQGLDFLESVPGVEGLMVMVGGDIVLTSGLSRYSAGPVVSHVDL